MKVMIYVRPEAIRTENGRRLLWMFAEEAHTCGLAVCTGLPLHGLPLHEGYQVNIIFEDYEHKVDPRYWINVMVTDTPQEQDAFHSDARSLYVTPKQAAESILRMALLAKASQAQWFTDAFDDAIYGLDLSIQLHAARHAGPSPEQP
jgi:hypothetical protein